MWRVITKTTQVKWIIFKQIEGGKWNKKIQAKCPSTHKRQEDKWKKHRKCELDRRDKDRWFKKKKKPKYTSSHSKYNYIKHAN